MSEKKKKKHMGNITGTCPITKKEICLFKRLVKDFKEIAQKKKSEARCGYVYRVSNLKESDNIRRLECTVHIELLESKSEFYVVITDVSEQD